MNKISLINMHYFKPITFTGVGTFFSILTVCTEIIIFKSNILCNNIPDNKSTHVYMILFKL